MMSPQRMSFTLLFKLLLLSLVTQQCHGLYDGSSNVIVLKDDFDTVLKSDGVWMVQFFAPWCAHCQQFVPKYERLAMVMRGIVHIAAIDATTESGALVAAERGVKGFPTMFIYGHDKTNPHQYQGSRDTQGMSQAVISSIMEMVTARGRGEEPPNHGPSKVVELSDDNFEEKVLKNPQVSMVAFVAPWCTHCHKLLPQWEEAAHRLAGEEVLLGTVDATIEEGLAADYGVKSFPTIKVFPGGLNKPEPKDYEGQRASEHIYDYAIAEIGRSGVPKEIPELTSMDVLKETCEGQNHICVLAALPHILDSTATGRNKYKDLLAAVSKSFRGSAYSFIWFEGGSQPDLEKALEMTFGYPALVALSLDRQAYAVQRGSFSEKAITGFLHSITSGRQPTIKLSKIPEIVTVEGWDGKDGTPLEEEPPLSEIMGDDFEGEL